MKQIAIEDFVKSVAAALQHVSYTHPEDFVHALFAAYEQESHLPAKNALLQLLINSKMSVLARRPVCQDTGVANVYVKMGMNTRFYSRCGQPLPSLHALVNQAIAHAYRHPSNPLRATMISDPLGERKNTRDNSPGVVHVELTEGERFDVLVAAKGGGGDVKARFKMLTARDSVADWIVNEIPRLGAGWCPPGVLGIGVGGAGPEETMRLAKEALYDPIDIATLQTVGPNTEEDKLRLEIFERINALKIGAQGLGGDTTVLDIKIRTAPCHAAMQPVALIPNCAATRFIRFEMDGNGPATMPAPNLDTWRNIPDLLSTDGGLRVNVDTLTKADARQWKTGQLLLLSGKILTARDAAHHRIRTLLHDGKPLPVDLQGRIVFYVGPVDPVGNEVIGPAGPTTSARMDSYLQDTLEQGVLATIGKAERTQPAVDLMREHGAPYLIAVGGAAYLASKSIVSSRVVAFPDLGMEAIYEFDVLDMPVTVATDAQGGSVYRYIPISVEY